MLTTLIFIPKSGLNGLYFSMKEIIGDLLLLGTGVAYGYIFLSILFTGGYQSVEPNIWILIAEIAMSLIIILVGIDRFLGDIKR